MTKQEYTQQQFFFMNSVALQCYINKEREDMHDLYDKEYRYSGMPFNMFLFEYYIPIHAKRFHEEYSKFYLSGLQGVVKNKK